MAFGRMAVVADLGLSVGHPQLADSLAARAADWRGACAVARDYIPPDAGAADPRRLVAGARRRVDRAWTAIVAVAWRDGGIRHGDLVRADFLCAARAVRTDCARAVDGGGVARSEEHTSELQSLMRISYAVFCLKKKKKQDKR